MKPLVSIITPVYNCEDTIGETIESVLNQTLSDFEMLIVDDISNDKTIDIIKKYQKQDKRIKLFILKEKGGAASARNKALKEASGQYIAFLDGDDLWVSDKLEKQIKFMQENNIYFSYADYAYIDYNGQKMGICRKCPKKMSYFRMLLGDSVGCLTVIYDSKRVGKIEIPNIEKRNDYALWCQILKKVKIGYKYNDILAYYRKSEKSLSSGRKISLLKYHYQMHRKINKFNPIVSLFFTITNVFNYFINKNIREISLKKYQKKKKIKIGILGHFANGVNLNDGQTVKTRNLYEELLKIYSEDDLFKVDTYRWKKHPFRLFLNCISLIKKCDNVVILPARNGILVFVPLLARLNIFYNKNLIYAVVGGWLPELVANEKKLIKSLQRFTIILVETKSMKDKLEKLGLKNVDILVNFKTLKIESSNKSYLNKDCYKLCSFSRVIKEKGIANAINITNLANQKLGKKVYTLDIYGPIAKDYQEEFTNLLKDNKIAKYCGIIDPKESVELLKKYDFLIFPTYYDGEGLAGTLIDSFFSGTPAIASNWKYNGEVITDQKNGFLFETKNDLEATKILLDIYNKKYDLEQISKNCIMEAEKYLPVNAIKGITKYIK